MIVNNTSGKVHIENCKAIILHSKDFKYVWSLKHERNSGIRNLDYPNNYIKAVKEADLKYEIVVVDLDNETRSAFKEAGITVYHKISYKGVEINGTE